MKSFKDLKAQFAPEPQIEIRIQTPDQCQMCGMNTREWMEAHENKVENGWLLLQLPQFPGIGLMGCPKCGNIQLNPNAMENIKIINEFHEAEKSRRIAVASGLVDPAGRVIGLKG